MIIALLTKLLYKEQLTFITGYMNLIYMNAFIKNAGTDNDTDKI